MNVNINKARGDAILGELKRYGYEAYLRDAQVLVRPIEHANSEARPQPLPIELSSQLNNFRGSILIALRMKEAIALADAKISGASGVSNGESTPGDAGGNPAKPIASEFVINTPGFGEAPPETQLKQDPILRDGENYGAE